MKTWMLMLTLALALSLVAAGGTGAEDGVERPREVLGGGASDSVAGGVRLRATLGQPVVGVVSGAGGEVSLGQGFWHGAREYRIYLPLVVRNDA
jgi:hypothetical protein